MNWLMLLTTVFLVGCTQANKKPEQAVSPQQDQLAVEGFERGNKLMDQQQYEKAAEVFDRILVDQPVSQLDTLILYNAGLSHLQTKNCEVAAERFRKIIRTKTLPMRELVGRAMLKLGDAYTCLGQDDKAVVTLVEVTRGSYNLPTEMSFAELPAKLAAAYARIGNRKEAEVYFRRSERGLIQLQSQIKEPQKKREILSRSLFTMGSLSQVNVKFMSAPDYFTTLRALQKYLFKSVELGDEEWSKAALEQLISGYQQAWYYIENPVGEFNTDPQIADREKTRAQVEVAQDAIQVLQHLYSERVPDDQESKYVSELMVRLRPEEFKFRNFIATHIVGTKLTPEALEAEGVQRAGRVFNPDPILERKAQGTKDQSKKKHPKKK